MRVERRRVRSCSSLVDATTGEVWTVEGSVGESWPLHPMQQALFDCDERETPAVTLRSAGAEEERRDGGERQAHRDAFAGMASPSPRFRMPERLGLGTDRALIDQGHRTRA